MLCNGSTDIVETTKAYHQIDGRIDGQIDERMDGWTIERTGERTDGQTDGRMGLIVLFPCRPTKIYR